MPAELSKSLKMTIQVNLIPMSILFITPENALKRIKALQCFPCVYWG
jgi:hypothetical protein